MKNANIQLKTLLLFLFIMPTTGSFAQLTDSLKKLPALQKIRHSAIDVKHIALDLQFDWQKKQAFGTATITLSPLNAVNTIALDAAKMTIKTVKTEKGKSLKFDYDGSEKEGNLKIQLDKVYKPTENIVLSIEYHTNHINETDPNTLGGSKWQRTAFFFNPRLPNPRKRKQIWSMAEYGSNSYWFPCHDVPDDFSDNGIKSDS